MPLTKQSHGLLRMVQDRLLYQTSGLVTAVANGTVTARATAKDGSGIYGTLILTISNQVVAVTGITVTAAGGATTITTDNGTLQLSASVSPANATNKAVTWALTNSTGQGTISAAGLVTAVASGTVTAKATAKDGSGVVGALIITISNQVIPVIGITVTGAGGASSIFSDNGTLQLSAAVLPANATNKDSHVVSYECYRTGYYINYRTGNGSCKRYCDCKGNCKRWFRSLWHTDYHYI